ncbi:MAG: hypothetical protein MUC96_26770 [Myxococcaceae bacterium]|jgi:hypothetical protein|nr:hypothetical protein [Myxococcaceae bacterium]
MLTTLVALTLAGAPLSFDDGAFLGWTNDGESMAWVGTRTYAAEPPVLVKRVVEVRNVVTATGDFFELEVRAPAETTFRKGKDAARWEAWLSAHPLVKLETLEGAKVTVKADGKVATTFGGTRKAVKLELLVEKGIVRQTVRSMLVEDLGKKLGKTTARSFFDPTGRRVAITLDIDDGTSRQTEVIEAEVAPKAFSWTKPGLSLDERRALERRIENAGFVAGSSAECPRPGAGVTVTHDAAGKAQAEALATALGGKAVKGKVDRNLGQLAVWFDCTP